MERSAEDCSALKRKKSSLTLDLNNSRVGKKAAAVVLQGHGGHDPHTPSYQGDDESCVIGYSSARDVFQQSKSDYGPGKSNAAQLNRFFIQPNGSLLASPACPAPLLLIKPTNEEQEAYARGFMDALMEIRKTQHISGFGGIVCLDGSAGNGGPSSFVTLTPVSPYTPMNLDGIQANLCPQLLPVNLTTSPTRTTVAHATPAHESLGSSDGTTMVDGVVAQHVKSAAISPVIVLSSSPPRPSSLNFEERTRQNDALLVAGNTPPQSPVVDASDPERVKLERKREKNRRAAQKCRTRKLERIERLERRTKELRDKNERLASQASDVRQQLIRLKQQIVQHFQNGCFVTETTNVVG